MAEQDKKGLALLASSPSLFPLAWRSSRWIWLQKQTYAGLVTSPAYHIAMVLLTSLLLVRLLDLDCNRLVSTWERP